MATVTAIFDACVLYPAPLRDLLMHLALLDVVRARWSADIHEEWMRSLLAQRIVYGSFRGIEKNWNIL